MEGFRGLRSREFSRKGVLDSAEEMGELGGGCRGVWAAEWRAVKLVVWVRLGAELR